MPAPAIAAWIVTLLSRLFMLKAGMWVASILAFFGLQFATQELAIEPILASIRNIGGSLPGAAAGWFAFFNLDKYITILFSAYTTSEGKNFVMRKIGA